MDGKNALVPWADMMNHSCEVGFFQIKSLASFHQQVEL